MLRWILITAFLLLGTGVLVASYLAGTGTPTGDLLVNLGAEILGIVITLAIVDWLLDRRRRQARAREIAWSVLHSIERVVWIWQGGSRRPEGDELMGLINGIEQDRGTLEPITRTLLVNLGTHARELLNREQVSIRTLPKLQEALRELTGLSSLAEKPASFDVSVSAEILAAGAEALLEITGGSRQPIPAGLIRGRDPSPAAQRRRVEAAQLGGGGIAAWGSEGMGRD